MHMCFQISADGDETHSDVFISAAEQELVKLKLEMQHTLPVGALLQACRSLDQVFLLSVRIITKVYKRDIFECVTH